MGDHHFPAGPNPMDPFKPYQPKVKGLPPSVITVEGAEALALQAVAFIVADDELLSQFLAVTGSDIESLRLRITERNFQVGVLDFLLADESAVLAFSSQNGTAPDAPMRARERLSTAT